jgi:hypothetical protein
LRCSLNYLTDEGAFEVNEATGTFSVNQAKVKAGVSRKLTNESCDIRRKVLTISQSDAGQVCCNSSAHAEGARPRDAVPTDIEPMLSTRKVVERLGQTLKSLC